jgi:hypothetical protein
MLDAAFAYAISLVGGVMDVVQTYNAYHCKMPVVGSSRVWDCVCCDAPARIPAWRRARASDALW